MVRLLQGDRKIIITLIATSYDQGIENSIAECTASLSAQHAEHCGIQEQKITLGAIPVC